MPSSRDRADEGGWSVVSSLELFVYDLDLLVEHLAGEAIDGHMHPVVSFTLATNSLESAGGCD